MIEDFQALLLTKTHIKNGVPTLYRKRTLEIVQSTLRVILEYAKRHDFINKNPFENTRSVTRNQIELKKKMTIITQEQFNQFLNVITDQTDRAMYSILYWCGLRFGEMQALNVLDCNESTNEFHIYKTYDPKNDLITTTKTGVDRYVSVPDRCRVEVDKLLKRYSDDYGGLHEEYILIGLARRMPTTSATRQKKVYLEMANKIKRNEKKEIIDYDNKTPQIPYFTFHELRHTHVSLLLSLGLTANDISKRLGHSVEMVNETYGHLFPKQKEAILDKLNSL